MASLQRRPQIIGAISGNLDARVLIRGHEEVSTLAAALNKTLELSSESGTRLKILFSELKNNLRF